MLRLKSKEELEEVHRLRADLKRVIKIYNQLVDEEGLYRFKLRGVDYNENHNRRALLFLRKASHSA